MWNGFQNWGGSLCVTVTTYQTEKKKVKHIQSAHFQYQNQSSILVNLA